MDFFIIIALIAASGMFSGLTIGLMGLSVDEVQRASDLGDTNAIRVLPIVKQGNLLLVTLLLGNTAVNATLSIFLGGIVGEGVMAGIISTALILIFGEVLPAAVLTRHALFVGAKVAGVVRILMALFYPFAGPIAFVLDRVLGAEIPELLNRRELCHVIEMHQQSEASDIDSLDRDLLIGALSLHEKRAEDIMTPKEQVYLVSLRDTLDESKIVELRETGYTRFPVIQDDRIVGVLNIKRLLGMRSGEATVDELTSGQKFIHIAADAKADDVLYRMIKGKVHMATVVGQSEWIGIVTMEDILEELVGHEISDEFGH
jgi:metal transporter CNNM